jgi:beta-phosphoglucomutase-like phosphatase (HAD superfamily)
MERAEILDSRRSVVSSYSIRALLFDFDDTIVESEMMNDALFVDFMKSEYSLALSTEDVKRLYALAWREVFSFIDGKYGLPEDKEAAFRKFMARKGEFLRGKTLRTARGIGRMLSLPVPRAIVSGSTRSEISAMLEMGGIREDSFDLIVTDDDCRRGKPDPEGFLRALHGFGVEARESLVFEDSTLGIEAARRAGIPVAFIAELSSRDNSRLADFSFETFENAYPWVKARIAGDFRRDLTPG